MLSALIILLVTIATCLWIKYYWLDIKDLPPGESGWPLIGYVPEKGKSLTQVVKKLRQKHGDIFRMTIGSRTNIFVCDYQTMKSCLSMAELTGRPDFYTLLKSRKFGKRGIIINDGPMWSTNRRFALKVLRDFGMGRSSLTELIIIEVNHLIDLFKTKSGEPFQIDVSLNVAIVNTILQLVMGRRYEIDDNEFNELVTNISDMLAAVDVHGPQQLNYNQWLLYVIPTFIVNNFIGGNLIIRPRDNLFRYLKKVIDDHNVTLDSSSPRDYIDMYLIEVYKNTSSKQLKESEYEELIVSLIDMFIAGSDTTSATIRWYLLYIAKHPEIQKKIHAEMDSVLPDDRLPELSDKPNLPYFEASIHDLNRMCSLVPFGIFHTALEDTIVGKYKIPKGTIIMPARELCHKDPKYWEKPDEFYPEHFIDKEGKFYIRKEGYSPFSLGRRQCLGESMAKMELFLFLGAILKTFEIHENPNSPITLANNPENKNLNIPFIQDIILKQRIK